MQVGPTFEITDMPGLVRGSFLGEGCGNGFLSDIRGANGIIHVLGMFIAYFPFTYQRLFLLTQPVTNPDHHFILCIKDYFEVCLLPTLYLIPQSRPSQILVVVMLSLIAGQWFGSIQSWSSLENATGYSSCCVGGHYGHVYLATILFVILLCPFICDINQKLLQCSMCSTHLTQIMSSNAHIFLLYTVCIWFSGAFDGDINLNRDMMTVGEELRFKVLYEFVCLHAKFVIY